MKVEVRRDSAGEILLLLEAESTNDKSLLGILAERKQFSVSIVTNHGVDGGSMPYQLGFSPIPLDKRSAP